MGHQQMIAMLNHNDISPIRLLQYLRVEDLVRWTGSHNTFVKADHEGEMGRYGIEVMGGKDYGHSILI